MIFFPYLFVGVATAVLVVAIWSLRWPRVKGTIEISIFDQEWEVKSSGSGMKVERSGKFYLVYTYAVDGERFQGTRISPLAKFDWQVSGASDLHSAREEARWYREGAAVDVYYCPLFPQWACLEPGGFLNALLLGIAASILFFLL